MDQPKISRILRLIFLMSRNRVFTVDIIDEESVAALRALA